MTDLDSRPEPQATDREAISDLITIILNSTDREVMVLLSASINVYNRAIRERDPPAYRPEDAAQMLQILSILLDAREGRQPEIIPQTAKERLRRLG